MNSPEQVALSNCEKEPVHIPGQIQPFGALLGFDLETGQVVHCSDNLSEKIFLGKPIPLGSAYDDVIDHRQVVHAIRGALGLPTIRSQRVRIGSFEIQNSRTDISVYVTDDVGVVEFEPDPRTASERPQSPVAMVRAMMSMISQNQGLPKLLQASVAALRHLTGHDRVMAYQFLDNGDGEVVAESKGPGIDTFLGLRYPAWDIPTQVRQIMLRSPFRVLQDIRAEHAALVSATDAKPLDMTFSHLRGISPIHVEYLENMGVRSTMNVSIIVRGELWGLFAFHHYRPRKLTPDQRSICELFGHLASMKIQQEEERDRLNKRAHSRAIVSAIGDEPRIPEESINRLGSDMMTVVACDGVGYLTKDSFHSLGETPDTDVVRKLTAMSSDDTVVADSLSSVGALTPAELNKTAGAMLLKIDAESHLVFFRNEVIHEIRWAGEKEKTITHGPNGPRLSPRGSFSEYRESVTGRCHPWTSADIDVATDIRRELMKSMLANSSEASLQWERQKKYQDLLIAELNHRVRNTLALVRSIAKQTTETAHSLEHYVESLEQRIKALSMAHDLVGGSGLQWARIEELIAGELKPFDTGNSKVSYSGPPIAVRADVAPIISLLFHEMTSNAVKHGALSDGGESLKIRWFEDEGGITLEWVEQLKTAAREPERRGFGFALIERALPYECGGRSSIEFKDKQLEIKFWLPTETVNRLESARVEATQSAPKITVSSAQFSNLKSVLVVEDNMVLAMELEKTLADLGAQEVYAFGTLMDAQDAIEKMKFDCAILDVNLGKEDSLELAIGLKQQGTPLVFATGYDKKYELPTELESVPHITKPVSRVDITLAIQEALDQREANGGN